MVIAIGGAAVLQPVRMQAEVTDVITRARALCMRMYIFSGILLYHSSEAEYCVLRGYSSLE